MPTVEIKNVVTYGKDELKKVNDSSLGVNNNITLVANDAGKYIFKKTDGTSATLFTDNMFIALGFSTTSTAPGDYTVTLGFRNNGATNGVYDLEVPVKVTVVAPECSVVKVPGYFNGDNVTVFGTPNNGKIEFNLNSLFDFTATTKVQSIRYTETKLAKNSSSYYPTWLSSVEADNAYLSSTSDKIVIEKYNNASNADNGNNVGATKEYTVDYRPYGNKYIPRVSYKFNVTVTSPVSVRFSGVAKTLVKADEPAFIFADEFTGTNLHNGSNIYLGNVYNSNGVITGAKYTDLIDNVTIAAKSDDVNSRFIVVDTQFAQYKFNKDKDGNATVDSTEAIKVTRSADAAGIVSDQNCVVNVTVTDLWGKITVMPVTVTVKPIAQ